jgi:hypothetical protein
MKQADEEFPSLNELIASMEQKFRVLEALKPSTNVANVQETQGGNKQRRSPPDSKTFVAISENKCVWYSKSHLLFECTVFLSADSPQRRSRVHKLKFCSVSGRVIQLEHVDRDIVVITSHLQT